jgi:hypothetical protein
VPQATAPEPLPRRPNSSPRWQNAFPGHASKSEKWIRVPCFGSAVMGDINLQQAALFGQISEAGSILNAQLPETRTPATVRRYFCPVCFPEIHFILLINKTLSNPFRIGVVLALSVGPTIIYIGPCHAPPATASNLFRQEACSRTLLLQFF